MEVVLEFLLEILGQLIIELLLDAGAKGLGRLLSSRITRTVLGVGLALGAGFAGGYWWGARLSELGRTEAPRSLWVSIGLALLFVAIAATRVVRRAASLDSPPLMTRDRATRELAPWRWSTMRLLGFAVLNSAVAAGIAIGFTPHAQR